MKYCRNQVWVFKTFEYLIRNKTSCNCYAVATSSVSMWPTNHLQMVYPVSTRGGCRGVAATRWRHNRPQFISNSVISVIGSSIGLAVIDREREREWERERSCHVGHLLCLWQTRGNQLLAPYPLGHTQTACVEAPCFAIGLERRLGGSHPRESPPRPISVWGGSRDRHAASVVISDGNGVVRHCSFPSMAADWHSSSTRWIFPSIFQVFFFMGCFQTFSTRSCLFFSLYLQHLQKKNNNNNNNNIVSLQLRNKSHPNRSAFSSLRKRNQNTEPTLETWVG